MKKEVRTIVYDSRLHLEAYQFKGMVQPFPSHFHEYYVIGLVEGGSRILSCQDQSYPVKEGSILLFNPGDSHACSQDENTAFDYRGINITKEVMLKLAEEIEGEPKLPYFAPHAVWDEEAACSLRLFHEMVLENFSDFGKDESLLSLTALLIQKYSKPFSSCVPDCQDDLEIACAYMERHYSSRISLDQVCRAAALSRSTLIRAFTRSKGITPYRYLENIRIQKAQKLLEQGALPVEAALQAGFSDQSHFTNCFRRFVGLSPGAYREIFKSGQEKGAV